MSALFMKAPSGKNEFEEAITSLEAIKLFIYELDPDATCYQMTLRTQKRGWIEFQNFSQNFSKKPLFESLIEGIDEEIDKIDRISRKFLSHIED